MITVKRSSEHVERHGTALFFAIVLIAVLAILSASFFRLNASANQEQRQYREDLRALYVAEAGLSEAHFEMLRGNLAELGSSEEPLSLGQARYWVTVEDLGTRTYSIVGTGVDGISREAVELISREIPDGFFRYAAFGKEGVELRPECFVDSYDASLGSYGSQYVSNEGHADEYGNVGSNQDVVMFTNTTIWGNATPGPEGVVVDDSPNTFVWGSTEPSETLVDFPPIDVPAITSSGSQTVSSGTFAIPPGDHHFDSMDVTGGTVRIEGPARVVLDDFVLRSGASLVVSTENGPVEIYGTGRFDLRSNSNLVTETTVPQDLTMYISTNNVDGHPSLPVNFSSNSAFFGAIYAPNANIELQANFEIYGSVMARRVKLGANSKVHYDTSLLFDVSTPPEFETLSWRRAAEL